MYKNIVVLKKRNPHQLKNTPTLYFYIHKSKFRYINTRVLVTWKLKSSSRYQRNCMLKNTK